MNRSYRRLSTTVTVPTTGVIATKVVTAKSSETETAHQRHERLAYQGSANVNSARVRNLGGGQFSVESQRKDSAGEAVTHYTVLWTGSGWLCECQFGQHQPGCECTHIARVVEYVARNKLALGVETTRAARVASEAVTEEWIARSRAARKARGRTEREEEV